METGRDANVPDSISRPSSNLPAGFTVIADQPLIPGKVRIEEPASREFR